MQGYDLRPLQKPVERPVEVAVARPVEMVRMPNVEELPKMCQCYQVTGCGWMWGGGGGQCYQVFTNGSMWGGGGG